MEEIEGKNIGKKVKKVMMIEGKKIREVKVNINIKI